MPARQSPYVPPQASLFEAADDGSVPCPGQWRLARIEVVNWGTFQRYHRIDVSRKGLLITGESGSGKSSLLDAVACVLTPPRALHLNAAAQGEGAHGRDRTVYSYVRGAWNRQADETGEVSSSYLRPKGATWSGVLLRYECGRDRPAVNLVALYHVKTSDTPRDKPGTLYAVALGERSLPDFERYVRDGIDRRRLSGDLTGMEEKAFREHGDFSQHFCRLLGLRGDKTLELLHRTQAAKNFGSLDELFRRFMLDEPATFDQCKEALEQFSSLRQAYEGVVDQRRQMEALEPLMAADERAQRAQGDHERAEHLQAALPAYTEERTIEAYEREQERLRAELDELDASVREAESELESASQDLDLAETAYRDRGGARLLAAETDLRARERDAASVERARKTLAGQLETAGLGEPPTTAVAWGALVREVAGRVDESEQLGRERHDEEVASYARVQAAKMRLEETDRELRHLRSTPTNIPRKLSDLRARLARELGLLESDLPFVGELIDVRPEYASWRGAIERVLHSQAQTLLVSHAQVQAVARYVDGTDLKLRLEFEDVADEIVVPPHSGSERSLVRRVKVADLRAHPEYSRWVNRLLRTQFDYTCVDTPDELADHRRALTAAGQVKRESRYVKDDRHPIDDRSRWVLGSSNDQKVEALEATRAQTASELGQAERDVQKIEARKAHASMLAMLSQTLQQSDWASYDIATAQRGVEQARAAYERLKGQSGDLDQLARARDRARARKGEADKKLNDLRVRRDSDRRDLDKLEGEVSGHRGRLATLERPTEDERTELATLFADCARDVTPAKAHLGLANPYALSNKVGETIARRTSKAMSDLNQARRDMERTIDAYRREWPVPSADLGSGADACEEYLRLHARIRASGLPEHERQFLSVLNQFSQDQITLLSSTIRGAFRDVKGKVDQVNSSLALSEYSPGIHLHIDVRDCRSAQVREFLSDLRAIASGSVGQGDLASAEERYRRTAKVMDKLQSDQPADKRWRRECLDTRRHVTFLAQEMDEAGQVQATHDSGAGLSGGQKQKLVIFCLAAALRYQLADVDNPVPSYGTVMLDEAFDKADHRFAATAMDIFEKFGFQMVLATPMKLLQTADDHVGGIAYVHCRDRMSSTVTLVSFEEDTTPRETP